MREFAIVDYFGYDLSPRARMLQIASAGFQGVMLLWSDQFDADYQLFPAYAREVGLRVVNAHAPYREAGLLWARDERGERYTDTLRACLRECAAHQVPTLVMHAGNGAMEPDAPDTGLARMTDLVETAEHEGINLAVENTDCPALLIKLLDAVSSPRLGFCFDSGHHHLYTPSLDLLSRYENRLMALHLHDNDGMSDAHALPGEGGIDWYALAKHISASPFSGAIALETLNRGFEHIDDPSVFLALALKRMQTIFTT